MKSLKIFAASLSVLLMAVFAACNTLPPLPPDDPNDTIPGDQPGIEDVIPEGVDIPEGAITVAEARAICAALESGATTGTKYYVKGWVKKLHNKHTQETIDQYGNGQFFMVDKMGDSDDLLAYQVYGLNGQKLVSVDQVEVGDYVVIYGELTNYNGTYETVGKGAAYIYSSSNPKIGEGGSTTPEDPGQVGDIDYEAGELSVSQLLDLDAVKALQAGDVATDSVIVRGEVISVEDIEVVTYGNATYTISDGTKTFKMYHCFGLNNQKFTNPAQLAKGDIVSVKGVAKNYMGTLEFDKGYITRTTNTTPYDGVVVTPEEPDVDENAIVFDASVDKDAADTGNQGDYSVTKDGITITLNGRMNLTDQWRCFKNQTMTVTSANGNIAKVVVFCTANGDAQYGPGCFTTTEGTYTFDGKIGTWVGDAASVALKATSNQVRITKVAVTLVQ